MKPTIPLIVALAALAGCTTTLEERRAADEAVCRDYGFRQGSEAFAECLQRIELDRRAERRASMASFERSSWPVVIYQPVPVLPPRGN
ncbi:hypothetical protein FY036_21560 [Mesorhizobium microcysteis]|uniref:Lipoprotein n=1 Tax=Neoaquamicrobium microcysteis TaxID=2682781 RepID=A0A5D4GSB2_9HYPH|nr:hypothetical protein [Mesorhizobium microcysteis]TYR29460.1 hypothetical protein FY036_21560 [Mesorhizobium microcysteis]